MFWRITQVVVVVSRRLSAVLAFAVLGSWDFPRANELPDSPLGSGFVWMFGPTFFDALWVRLPPSTSAQEVSFPCGGVIREPVSNVLHLAFLAPVLKTVLAPTVAPKLLNKKILFAFRAKLSGFVCHNERCSLNARIASSTLRQMSTRFPSALRSSCTIFWYSGTSTPGSFTSP